MSATLLRRMLAGVPQLSLFSADFEPPTPVDAAGLLAAHGQSTLTGETAQISIVLGAHWRAEKIQRELQSIGMESVIGEGESGERCTLATARCAELVPTVKAWRRGAVSAVPENWVPTPGQLRLWAFASGRHELSGHYKLGIGSSVENHTPRQEALRRGLAGIGIASKYVGARGGGPALRLSTAKARKRLADIVGEL